MIVKRILKDGTIKIYEYNTKEKGYYENYKANQGGYTFCSNCGAKILSIYINKHKQLKKCLTYDREKNL